MSQEVHRPITLKWLELLTTPSKMSGLKMSMVWDL